MERSFDFGLRSSRTRLFLAASVLLIGASAVEACSATGGSNFNTGGASSEAGAGAGTASSADGVGSLAGPGSGGSTGSGGIGGACATSSVKGKLTPLDMYIMLDQSGSMSSQNKWTNCTNALKTFLQAPESDGIGVGIQYFPIHGPVPPACMACNDCNCIFACGCNGCTCINNVCSCSGTIDSCTAADYAKPEVPIAPLPMNAQPLISSINMHMPNGGTPTRPALEGALTYAKDWAIKNIDHHVVVVLATDGDPSGCTMNTIPDVEALASGYFNGSPSLPTYVVGVGTSLVSLNGIAAAGGTTKAFIVDAGGNTVQQFIDAMNTIRKTAGLGCEYSIPAPMGGMIDFSKVNVQYVPGGGGKPIDILHAKDPSQCDPVTGGWYYNDNANPTKIELCPATCMVVEKDSMGEINIIFGCETIDIPPK